MDLKFVLFLILYLFFMSISADVNQNMKDLFKDYQYINTTQGYYKYHPPSNWTAAQQVCQSEGSTFWYPKNYDEAHDVISLFNKTQKIDWIYIGISDTAVEGSFKTIDGIPMEDVYNRWASSQPDNSYEEDCVHISKDFYLNDIQCYSMYPFVCKKTENSVQEYNKLFNINHLDVEKAKKSIQDYIYVSTTNEYYKFHSPSNWLQAQKTCESEDSRFWYPKSRVEAHTVLSLFSGTQTFDSVYVGISYSAMEGAFETIDGISIADVYHTWHWHNQPDNYNNEEDCVFLDSNITLSDVNCIESYPFICRKSATQVPKHENHCVKHKGNLGTQAIESYQYIEATKASYKFHKTSETWSDAKRICESEGARLFYSENHDEMQEVLAFSKLQDTFTDLFIGVSDLVVEGDFETIDGMSLSEVYNDWQPGEPNNFNCTENCLTINDKGQLNDKSCSRKYPFVCKKIKSASEWNDQCKISNLDYAYNKEQSKCYKLHKTPQSWIDANRICREEQSYLAVINSKRERDHLLSLTRPNPDKITEVSPKKFFHLGFHNRLNDGWITVKGMSLDDSGYAHWDVNQPNGSIHDNVEKCGSMSHTGRLHDVPCDTKNLFICEHDIK